MPRFRWPLIATLLPNCFPNLRSRSLSYSRQRGQRRADSDRSAAVRALRAVGSCRRSGPSFTSISEDSALTVTCWSTPPTSSRTSTRWWCGWSTPNAVARNEPEPLLRDLISYRPGPRRRTDRCRLRLLIAVRRTPRAAVRQDYCCADDYGAGGVEDCSRHRPRLVWPRRGSQNGDVPQPVTISECIASSPGSHCFSSARALVLSSSKTIVFRRRSVFG